MPKMSKAAEATKNAQAFIEKYFDRLTIEEDIKYFEDKKKALKNAIEFQNGEEQEVLLAEVAVQWANDFNYILVRRHLQDDESLEAFYALPVLEELAKDYAVFKDQRAEKWAELNAKQKELQDEEEVLDLFKGVLNGLTPEQAKKQLDAYKAKLAANNAVQR